MTALKILKHILLATAVIATVFGPAIGPVAAQDVRHTPSVITVKSIPPEFHNKWCWGGTMEKAKNKE